ncbi:hypothetical protein CLI85_07560 [Tannerella forsythia]|nr:hypothetical protein CLI85_07560 [Tannerella forsythia]
MKLLMESAGIDFFGQRKRKHFSILCFEGIKSQSTAGGTFLNSTYGFFILLQELGDQGRNV